MGRKQGKRTKREVETYDGGDLDAGNPTPAASQALSFDTLVASVKTSRYLQALIGLTLVGFLLRFYNLGWNSLWLDEASTLTFARQSLIGIWESTAGGEFNPPLFYWLEHGLLLSAKD